jgi:glycosyltransferase involved in cell wall biosynthesis
MVMSRLRIAVIIATYNRATLLDEAIGCLLAQTRVPDEIVVVDDGSTDQTPDVLAGYGPPVKVVRQANRGLPAARNTGLRTATADLIAFLDLTIPCCQTASNAVQPT